MRECVDHFSAGLTHLSAKRWSDAIACFEQSAQLERDQPGASPEIERNPSTCCLEMARADRAASDRV